jgi:hypothetical protein
MLEQLRRRRACRNVPTEAAAEKVPRTSRQPARPCRQLFCARDLVHHPKRIGTQLVPRRCTRGEFYHDAAHAPDVRFPAVVVLFQHLWSHPRCSPTATAVTHWPSGASVAKASHAKAQNDGQRAMRAPQASQLQALGATRNAAASVLTGRADLGGECGRVAEGRAVRGRVNALQPRTRCRTGTMTSGHDDITPNGRDDITPNGPAAAMRCQSRRF